MKTITTTNIREAQQAIEQGKIVKTQKTGKEVQVLQLIPGLYGTSWQMRYSCLGRVDYADIMADKSFTIYK